MAMKELSTNYAVALYGLIDASKQEAYLSALREIQSLFEEDPILFRALTSYSLMAKEKDKLIDSLSAQFGLAHLGEFLKVISRHHRFSSFPLIVSAFASLVNESLGIKEGVAYSATKLTPSQLSSIQSALQKKLNARVELKNIVDPNLIGGVKVALDGKVYDGTIRSKLLELSQQLTS